jgi:hypothetical protein
MGMDVSPFGEMGIISNLWELNLSKNFSDAIRCYNVTNAVRRSHGVGVQQ